MNDDTKATDQVMKAAGRAGARLLHTEDQHEVICFRPEALLAFVRAERERCAKVCEGMESLAGPTVHDVARAIRQGGQP